MKTKPSTTTTGLEPRASIRAWGICGLMLWATMLNYMDRQALAQQATEISRDLGLSNEDYAQIESGFGLAFAVGGIVTGLLADRVSPQWLYPAVLIGWSGVGFATGAVTSYRELYVCRILLGFFESGQWPCALITAQRLLSRRDRPLGNGILQSGASLGAIVTPVIVYLLATDARGGWRLPFWVIGASGVFWVVAWLAIVRAHDLSRASAEEPMSELENAALESAGEAGSLPRAFNWRDRAVFLRRLFALAVVVITINLCWQFFRAWMPKMLREQYQYTANQVQAFSVGYYVAADIGCIGVGLLVKWMVEKGWPVHGARLSTFFACSLLTATSLLAAFLPASWLLLAVFLLIGFGSLGQFPTYYAFTQELSARRMGNVTGILSFVFWLSYGMVSGPVGAWIDRTGSFSQVMLFAGLLPLLGLLALVLLWGGRSTRAGRVLD